jgi:hypothetical protein
MFCAARWEGIGSGKTEKVKKVKGIKVWKLLL